MQVPTRPQRRAMWAPTGPQQRGMRGPWGTQQGAYGHPWDPNREKFPCGAPVGPRHVGIKILVGPQKERASRKSTHGTPRRRQHRTARTAPDAHAHQQRHAPSSRPREDAPPPLKRQCSRAVGPTNDRLPSQRDSARFLIAPLYEERTEAEPRGGGGGSGWDTSGAARAPSTRNRGPFNAPPPHAGRNAARFGPRGAPSAVERRPRLAVRGRHVLPGAVPPPAPPGRRHPL